MIEAQIFIEAARARSFEWYAGVPCSFLTPFINHVSRDPALRYFSAANEGDAVALIAGAGLGGRRAVTMMQNSGLGNAVSPLTSLTWTFRIPQLLIVTWRGEPGVKDEPQHALTGRITGTLLETMEIPWEPFPSRASEVEKVLDRAVAQIERESRPYALVMRKNTVKPCALEEDDQPPSRPAGRVQDERDETGPSERPVRSEALERIVALTPLQDTVVLATTGFTGRQLYALADRPNQLYMVGSMGCVGALGLGLSLARPDLRVVAIDGDGAALMRMGLFATVGAYAGRNFVHILLDNARHESTGGQATVSRGVSFGRIAAACGYSVAQESGRLDVLDEVLTALPESGGPRFVRLMIRPGTPEKLPRPELSPVRVRERLMRHIGVHEAVTA